MNWGDFINVPYGILSIFWPNGSVSRSIHPDNNYWLNDYTSLNHLDESTLAGFIGNPRICSYHEVDLKCIYIDSDLDGPNHHDGNPIHSSFNRVVRGLIDIMLTKKIPSKLMEIDLTGTRDGYGILVYIQLCLPTLYERVSWDVLS